MDEEKYSAECHLCGGGESELLDIWYPKNASKSKHFAQGTKYIRVCSDCVDVMAATFDARLAAKVKPEFQIVHRTGPRLIRELNS